MALMAQVVQEADIASHGKTEVRTCRQWICGRKFTTVASAGTWSCPECMATFLAWFWREWDKTHN